MAIDLLTVTFDQAEAMIRLLTEIRDRLPKPPASEMTRDFRGPAMMFGYVLGSGEHPTDSQVRLAQEWLRLAEERGAYPLADWDAAVEIVNARSR